MNNTEFENKVKGLKKEELITLLVKARTLLQPLKELQASQKLIDNYIMDRKGLAEKDAPKTWNTQNKIKEWILSAYDKGQDTITLNPIEFVLVESFKFFYTTNKDGQKPQKIEFLKLDYNKLTLKFAVFLDDFSAKEIEYLNREYNLNLPISTEQHLAEQEKQEKSADDLFFS